MRERIILIVASLCSIVFAGCTKNIGHTPEGEIEIVFNVGDKGGFGSDTKALRKGWQAGDQILIVFSKTGSNTDLGVTSTLTYDGTNWSATALTAEQVTELGWSGKYKAIHYKPASGQPGISGISLKEIYNSPGFVLEYTNTYTYVTSPQKQILLNGNMQMSRANFCHTQISVPNINSYPGLEGENDWYMFVYSGGDKTNENDTYFNVLWGISQVQIQNDFTLFGSSASSYMKGEKVDNDYVFTFINPRLKVGDGLETQGEVVTKKQLSYYIFFIQNKSSRKDATKFYYYIVGRGPDGNYVVEDKDYKNPLLKDKAYILPEISSPNWSTDMTSFENLIEDK
jgi:hypothetical protein